MTFEQNLINLVAEYELLYDPNHPLFPKTPSRTAAWEEIALKLNSDRDTCKKRWKNLRDTYRKLLQKIHEAGGVYRFRRRKWQYLSLISFLNKFEPLAPAEGTTNWPIYIDTSVDAFTRDAVTGENLPVKRLNTGETISSSALPVDTCVRNEYYLELIEDSNSNAYLEQQQCVGSMEPNKTVVELTHTYAKSIQNENNEVAVEQQESEYVGDVILEEVSEVIEEENVAGPCCSYLAMLGAKIDSLPVPMEVRANLQQRIADLVCEVIAQYDVELDN